MKLIKNLNEFNRRMAEVLQETFAPDVEAWQTPEGKLVFRGPIQGGNDPEHTHFAVMLDSETRHALDTASPADREEMTQNLLNSLGSSVKCQYDPANIKQYALEVTGTKRHITG